MHVNKIKEKWSRSRVIIYDLHQVHEQHRAFIYDGLCWQKKLE